MTNIFKEDKDLFEQSIQLQEHESNKTLKKWGLRV
jgi:hypothetical protein